MKKILEWLTAHLSTILELARDLGHELRPYALPLLVIAIGVLIAVFVTLVRRSVIRLPAVGRDLVELEAAAVVDLTPARPSGEMKRSFAEVRHVLRWASGSQKSLYSRPWVMAMGDSLVGRRALLTGSELALPFGQPSRKEIASHPGAVWWISTDGVVLDLLGDDLLDAGGPAQEPAEWKSVLALSAGRGRDGPSTVSS